ncbi:hypothetical protein [Micromonospora okii]|uniref:hypothetical protein n=1 Tax=Micromonospora okii TaxID=1182970 RepID=UPI001E3AD466|nr:hypothetical protein [Micromonospora okii]
MATTIYCETCGKTGATEVVPPSGGTAEMCGPCIRYDRRQAAIDARWAELADLTDDQAALALAA